VVPGLRGGVHEAAGARGARVPPGRARRAVTPKARKAQPHKPNEISIYQQLADNALVGNGRMTFATYLGEVINQEDERRNTAGLLLAVNSQFVFLIPFVQGCSRS
jgi:hypothetical protein